MDKKIVVQLHASFEDMVQKNPQTGTEFWCARDLQMLLGYAKWENFAKVVDKAITSCQTAGYDPKDHFLGVRKMVDLGSGAKREIDDIALTRYACYLIAQNGDPTKDQIAFAVADVRVIRSEPLQALTFLNDVEHPVNEDNMAAIRAYDIQPLFWSRQKDALASLNGAA